jgi:pimeloyl-ACP methyl ester carboxylesterase
MAAWRFDAERLPMSAQSLARVFDRSGKIRRPANSLVLGEAWSVFSYYPPLPNPAEFPNGRGHVVLLVPGLFTSDAVNRQLQRFLNACGYRAFGWNLGVNWGPTPRRVTGLRRRLAELREIEAGPVSLVGLSLGGLLARDLAYQSPRDVRQVITIASPFHLPTATILEPFIHLCALCCPPAIDVARLASPLPVPSAAIYSRQDGIVAWESCRSDDRDCLAIEVGGAHFAACRNPEVFRAVARRLAHVPDKACPREGGGGNRFSDKDMRKIKESERIPIRLNRDAL